jgi:hypothetical protein
MKRTLASQKNHTVALVVPRSMDTNRGNRLISRRFRNYDNATGWLREMNRRIDLECGNRWGRWVRVDGKDTHEYDSIDPDLW